MGYTRWDSDSWSSYSASTSTKSTKEIFTKNSMDADLDPHNAIVRESRDSDLNPESTACIIASDVTGSMGILAEKLVRKGIGTLFEEILDRKPITDPHLMIMGVGDATQWDTAPLQVSQFEADLTIASWLEKIYVEGAGGGNQFESYDLPYWFAANRTSIDCFEKRGKKGYIFTIGDEPPPPMVYRDAVKKATGEDIQADMPFTDLLEQAQKMYHTFHVIVAEGSYARSRPGEVKEDWQKIMGQNVIWLEDYHKLSEVIVSVIEVTEGRDADEVVASWSGDTSLVVKTAVSDLTAAYDDAKAVVRL